VRPKRKHLLALDSPKLGQRGGAGEARRTRLTSRRGFAATRLGQGA